MELRPILTAVAIAVTRAVSVTHAKKAATATAVNVKTAFVHRAHVAMVANRPERPMSIVVATAPAVRAGSPVWLIAIARVTNA